MAESELDTKRVSLLDVINSKRQAAGEPAEIVTRVTCVAKLTDNLTSHRANTLSAKYQQLVKRLNESSSGVTGLVLLYPACCALQIEAAPHVVNTFLAALRTDAAEYSVASARVVSLTDDVPARAFHEFRAAFADGEVKEHADTVDAALAVQTASRVNLQFLAFASQIIDLKESEVLVALNNITTYWDGMPKVEQVLSLLTFVDAPLVTEFLDMFDGPVNIDLESERVWPMPRMPEVQ